MTSSSSLITDSITALAGFAGLFLLPVLALLWLMHRRRVAFRARSLEPFTDLPLRPPGESLRLKIEELDEQFTEAVAMVLVASIAYFMATVASPPVIRRLTGTVFFAFSLGSVAWQGRRLFKLQRELWDYRLGFTGERIVGEELNRLVALGFQVFHDLPFEGYNLDHVLVGPSGVYVVETKSHRKPAHLRGAARATVFFDGTRLSFPTWTDTRDIEQVRRNARTLSVWLTKGTGEATSVKPILTLPGWWVERTARSDVNVLNPKQIRRSFPATVANPLPPDRIQRIAHLLSERCRLTKSS